MPSEPPKALPEFSSIDEAVRFGMGEGAPRRRDRLALRGGAERAKAR